MKGFAPLNNKRNTPLKKRDKIYVNQNVEPHIVPNCKPEYNINKLSI